MQHVFIGVAEFVLKFILFQTVVVPHGWYVIGKSMTSFCLFFCRQTLVPFIVLILVPFLHVACIVYSWRVEFISVKKFFIGRPKVVTILLIF